MYKDEKLAGIPPDVIFEGIEHTKKASYELQQQ